MKAVFNYLSITTNILQSKPDGINLYLQVGCFVLTCPDVCESAALQILCTLALYFVHLLGCSYSQRYCLRCNLTSSHNSIVGRYVNTAHSHLLVFFYICISTKVLIGKTSHTCALSEIRFSIAPICCTSYIL